MDTIVAIGGHLQFKVPLSKLTEFKAPFWLRLGEKVCTKVRNETKGGSNVKGGQFKKYDDRYATRKAQGKFKRQSSQSTKPDLMLTGDMMNSLQTHSANKDGVIVGWADQFNASKVKWNEDEGRSITKDTGFPFSKTAESLYDKELDKEVNKMVKAQKETIVIDTRKG